MEHFENNPRNVKEKSVYLLHLDTPRIIILASVIIGLILLSFLVGMNFVKGDRGDIVAGNDLLFNSGNSSLPGDKKIPALPDSGNGSLLPDEKIVNTEVLDEKNRVKDEVQKEDEASQDILTSDNIKDILPPAGESKKDDKAIKTVQKKKKAKSKVARSSKKSVKSRKNARRKKSRKKSRVIEVSDRYRSSSPKTAHYSIQVASFDTKRKADREARRLRKMNYDASVKGSRVKGKKYYRVKIGPVFNKKKAIKLLNNVQGNYRYRNSYMVKE
jgi:cell division septation protein DedD